MISIGVLGSSLGAFFALGFLACRVLSLLVPDQGMHKPWLQFFPGFEWLTLKSVVIALGASTGPSPNHRIGDRFRDIEEMKADPSFGT